VYEVPQLLAMGTAQRKEEVFKFKCLLNRGQPAPSDSRLKCSPPRRRRSFWRPHRWGRKTWCEVQDWKKSACIQLKMSAVSSCGVKMVLRELTTVWGFFRDRSFRDYLECVEREMKLEGYNKYAHPSPTDVPRQNYVAFNLVMTLGFINALAALRDESKNPSGTANATLLDPFSKEHDVDADLRSMFSKAFDTEYCGSSFLEECVPTWKARLDRWPLTLKSFISNFLIFGFWTVFWGGLTLLGGTLLLAAIGISPAGVLALGYLVVTTAAASLFGFLSAIVHCGARPGTGFWEGLTPRLCEWRRKGPLSGVNVCNGGAPILKYEKEKDETWTDVIEEARKEA